MKKTILLLAVAGALALQSCENNKKGVNVNAEVKEAFTAKYPGAKDVRWNTRNTYSIAEFKDNGTNASAWFDGAGTWYMTETDIPYVALPQTVQTAFKASDYGVWRVDDVDMIEREGAETVYVIEVEQGASEADLYYTPDGVLVKTLFDTDNDDDYEDFIPTQLPEGMQTYLDSRYPGWQMIEVDREQGRTEVEIVQERTAREVVFDAAGQWVSTTSDIRRSEVPQAVLQAIAASSYSGYEIDDIELVETPAGTWYVIELEDEINDREVRLRIDAGGTIL